MKKGLPQEMLKLIACAAMLIDHVGAVFFPQNVILRIVGRLAYPIYAFLLVKGAEHTRSPGRYGLRLLIGALLSEMSFDWLFFGGITWQHQSVMVTLLIGFGMLVWMKRTGKWGKVVPLAAAFLAAELCCSDYGGWGIALIWIFAVTGENLLGWCLRIGGMTLVLWLMSSAGIWFGPVRVPIQLFALLSLIPICLYSGRKLTGSRLVQTAFYLFYPVHMTVLLAIVVFTR